MRITGLERLLLLRRGRRRRVGLLIYSNVKNIIVVQSSGYQGKFEKLVLGR
jgi:hypothetical protein